MAIPDLDTAFAIPPQGVTANLTNPPNHATLAYSTLVVSAVLITFFTWSRSVIKAWVVRSWRSEDYLVLLAWVAAIVNIAAAFKIYEYAPIIHTWDTTWRTYSNVAFYSRIANISYNLAVLIIKLAMLIQVLHIFIPSGSKSKTFYIVHFLIWVNMLYYITAIFLMVFTCTPVKKSWKPWMEGKCMKKGVIGTTTSIFNLCSDVAILAVTQQVIWSLIKIDRWKRVQLSAVFCAGIVPCAFAVLCLVYNVRMLQAKDFVYDAAIMALACHGEITSGLFVLFLPVLPRFLTFVRKESRMSAYFQRGPSRLGSSDMGVVEEPRLLRADMEKNVWKTSHLQTTTDSGTMSTVWEEESRGAHPFREASVESRSWLSTSSLDDERGFVH